MDIDLDFKHPMLVFTGLLIRVNVREARLNDKTGEFSKPALILQLMCNNSDESGNIKSEVKTLNLKNMSLHDEYKSLTHKIIRVPVGFMNTKDGGGIFWAMPSARPEVVNPLPVSTVKAA